MRRSGGAPPFVFHILLRQLPPVLFKWNQTDEFSLQPCRDGPLRAPDARVCRRAPEGLQRCSVSHVVLHGVDGSAAVFVPQVNGFGNDGVCVLLRDLRVEKPLEEQSLLSILS